MSHKDSVKSKSALRSLKLCFSGAAPLLAETRSRFESQTGALVMEGYSLTEAQMAVIANPPLGAKKIGSVGMPLPDVDLRIVDTDDTTREVAQGEPGEVLIAAPQLMRGYWNQPDETAAMMSTDANGVRWLHTGDIGYLDEDGYLFLTDRKKELIKVSGFQVWPREVEEVISAHPAVLEAGVAPVSDPAKGEVPKAWVVLRAGRAATADELRAFCRGRLAPYKVPAQVSIVSELPKTAVGKVLRRKLKELDSAQRQAANGIGQ
jgi:long-chain acyl-CoA synthetase